jgi:hypothetical protein
MSCDTVNMSLDSEMTDAPSLDSGASPATDDMEEVATTTLDAPPFAPTPIKVKNTYQKPKNSARKGVRRPPPSGLGKSKESKDDDDVEPEEDSEREEPSTAKPTRASARRQSAQIQKPKPAVQPKSARKSVPKAKGGKAKLSPVASEGSELTDIEDAGEVDEDVAKPECESRTRPYRFQH